MSETEIVTLPGTANEYSLTRFMPRDLPELVRFSEYASKSGVFGTLTPGQALIVMLQGAELGINPLQALREIPLVNGKPRPSATLVAGLIQRSPLCEEWHVESSPTSCTIRAKRKNRGSEFVVNIRLEDVPASLKSKQVWRDNPEDMLVARAIHRIARRAFADILAGIQDPDEIDETRVIDVARVEREIKQDGPYDKPHAPADEYPNPEIADCRGRVWLQASKRGGAFLACDACGMTWSPPQEVRDAIRGIPEHLTLAAGAETVLEPGERTPSDEEMQQYIADHNIQWPGVDAPESAVQSDSESARIDEVAVPASAETPIPEPEAPDPVEEARAIDWMESWRRDARSVIATYLDIVRALPNGGPERRDAIVALKASGWDSDGPNSQTFVETCSDQALAELLQAFHLEAHPKSTTEDSLL
jgi:hypothetical protein